jgi:hypothetical protein
LDLLKRTVQQREESLLQDAENDLKRSRTDDPEQTPVENIEEEENPTLMATVNKIHEHVAHWDCHAVKDVAKREVKYKELSPEDRVKFDAAIRKECDSFVENEAASLVPPELESTIPRDRVVPARFLLTRKDVFDETGKLEGWKEKARLINAGQLDPDLATGLRTDAPASNLFGVNLVLSLCVMFHFIICCGDVSTAFLAGEPISRELYMRLPFQGFPSSSVVGLPYQLMRLHKCVYGLADAPRAWYLKFTKILASLGFVACSVIPTIWILRDATGKLCGILTLHVDDVISGGKGLLYDRCMDSLKRAVKFGSWQVGQFCFLGRQVFQHVDYTITLTMEYVIKPIAIAPHRDPEDICTPEEKSSMLSFTGQADWLARNLRMDVSFAASYLKQLMPELKVQHLHLANLIHKRITSYDYCMHYPMVNLDKLVVVVAADASPSCMPRQGSQGGFAVCLAENQIVSAESPIHAVAWGSHRLKRPCPSSMHAEALALSEATKVGDFVRAALSEILFVDFALLPWEQVITRIPCIWATDSKGTYDVLDNEGSIPTDKQLAVEIASLRRDSRRDNQTLKWIPGPRNLTDVLTKLIVFPSLVLEAMSRGVWALYDTEGCQLARALARDAARMRRTI